LINNAGIYPTQDFLKVTEEQYQKTIDINLNSVFWMCQWFINRRKKLGGVIVNISSIEAILPFKKDLIPYSVSKIGVIALTRSIARDYGIMGFRANVILPGAIKTPGTSFLINDALKNLRFGLMQVGIDFQHRLALGRWGKPEEVANVILILSSDMASYVQGAVIPVDGGFLSS
jgi:NAD(P)-dependent dehydrogenase (short-subunit alcohol dehydrogenase family)